MAPIEFERQARKIIWMMMTKSVIYEDQLQLPPSKQELRKG